MKLKIKSTIVPREYLDKFPSNDLNVIKGEDCKFMDYNGKIIKNNDHEKLLNTIGNNPYISDVCGSSMAILG